MISTKELQLLPDSNKLKETCKAMAVLDAILCQDWVYRYYSYNSEWSETEEFFEMRNGQGEQLLILFRAEGTVINGFSADAEPCIKAQLTDQLPEVFHEFIFGEPVHSAGTTFCVWKLGDQDWTTALPAAAQEISEELLSPLDGSPLTYVNWATDYFKGSYPETGIPLEIVTQIYNQQPLTRDLVNQLTAAELQDWEQLEEDLVEISYPYHINP